MTVRSRIVDLTFLPMSMANTVQQLLHRGDALFHITKFAFSGNVCIHRLDNLSVQTSNKVQSICREVRI